MKMHEIMSDADYPILYHLIKSKLDKGEEVRFHSDGTEGLIVGISYEMLKTGIDAGDDGFALLYVDSHWERNRGPGDKPDYTHVRPAELENGSMQKSTTGWHVELPNYEEEQLRKSKARKDREKK